MRLQEIYTDIITNHPNRYTDKGIGTLRPGTPLGHTFCEIYDLLLDKYVDQPINFLEIGISKGGSLMMWREYFPKAYIYGIDIFKQFNDFKPTDDIKTFILDATNEAAVDAALKDLRFNIILDDAAHDKESQLRVYNIFSKRVVAGGLYLIEDVNDIDNDLPFFSKQKIPTVIDRRLHNNLWNDVILLYQF